LRYLAECGVTRVLVEGGGELHASFLDQGLADRLVLYIAPKLIGGRDARSLVGGLGPRLMDEVDSLKHYRTTRIGEEILIEADL
jgi:diaminohydroxyphosphoribosylaminopyrimidine deaminase/5-amino-6-(5-phosphoribosylamino)uracil reductase